MPSTPFCTVFQVPLYVNTVKYIALYVSCINSALNPILYGVFQVPLYVNTVKYIALYVAYINSALNPILYGGFNENFRRGFKDVFHCILAKKNNKVHPGNNNNNNEL